MNNARKELEKEMRAALRHIAETGELPPLNDPVRVALKECQDAGYIEGLRVDVMASGRIKIETAYPRVKHPGMKFAYPYRDWKFILPSVIAALELVVIIIQTIRCA